MTLNLSHLFQSAVLSAQSALAEEEEEEKYAGHLRFSQEPQPNFVQSGTGVWSRGLFRRMSLCGHSTHRVRVCTNTTHTLYISLYKIDITIYCNINRARKHNAYSLDYNTFTQSFHILLPSFTWSLIFSAAEQSAALNSINTPANITLNLPQIFVEMADSCRSAGMLKPPCEHRCRWQPVAQIHDPTVSKVIRDEHAACQIQNRMAT